MKKRVFLGLTTGVATIAATVCITVSNVNNTSEMSDLMTKNIEVLSTPEDGSEWGCGGNPTFTKNQTLKSAICINGGTRLKCKKEEAVCCDPSKQTDCDGIGGIF